MAPQAVLPRAAGARHRSALAGAPLTPRTPAIQPRRLRAQRRPTTVCESAPVGGAPLVVVGSINADYVLPVERLPKAGETLAALRLDVFPGGKGANQAAAAAKLGYPTNMVGQLGTDGAAGTLRGALVGCGVDDTHVRVVQGVSSGTAIILLQPSGENSIVIVGGANTAPWELSADTEGLISRAGAVLLQREIPEDVNTRVAKIAAAAGVPVILDAGGAEGPLAPELLANVSVLSPNETELARLTGAPTDSEAQIVAAAQKLQALGVNTVLVKLGSAGALCVADGLEGGFVKVPAFRVSSVVDTTGAGDCFTGAFAVGILEGRDYADAMAFAAAAAAVCVQREGAIPSLPTRAEALAVMEGGA